MRHHRAMTMTARATLVAVLIAAVASGTVAANEPEPQWVPSFNESPGCNGPYENEVLDGVRGPLADKPYINGQSSIPASHPVYGPWADYYGRTQGQIHSRLVKVHLPGQPKDLWVHERVLPAFNQVLANLAAEAADGNVYEIRSDTWSYNPVTIPPGRSYSFHTVGAAIDVNSNANPYRADNVLITDMPDWFVDAWREAGFCWGGDWQTIKDPMHFSWMGPLHTPGYEIPAPYPPIVARANFTAEIVLPVALPPATSDERHFVADMDRDGAADVVRVREHNGLRRVATMQARWWYQEAQHSGTTEVSPTDPGAPAALADLTRDGRPDLVYVLDDGGTVLLEVFAFAGFPPFSSEPRPMPRTAVPTAAPYNPNAIYLFDDHNRDGDADLFIVDPSTATLRVWLGPDFTEQAVSTNLTNLPATTRFALGERGLTNTLDGIPDLFALADNGTLAIYQGPNYTGTPETINTGIAPTGEDLFIADLDGDGFGDLMLVDGQGNARMRRGGASTHHPGAWFALSTHLVTRLAGANRYATAAAVSADTYTNPAAVDTVFIATGIDYPDALAGAAVAGRDGAPLLLVEPGSVPAATAAEIARLGPSTIVLLGGPSAVSPAVATALAAHAPTLRLAGPNRYATAVEISKHAYPQNGSADAVVIATGTNFADALAGAPAAAALNGPVLLTRGDSLPQVTRDEIARLAPDEILVIGGPNAVSDAVVAQLGALAPTRRVAGATRYDTAVALSKDVFPTADRIYVATGLNFPDALAGAATAASLGAPLLLVPGSSVPANVLAEITRLGGGTIVILGGTAVVSTGVQTTLMFAGL